MTTFDKREEAFERQFVHDEGVRFKALARRNKRLGLWAPSGSAGPAPKLNPTPRYWPPSNSSITVTPRSPARSRGISMLPGFRSQKPRYGI